MRNEFITGFQSASPKDRLALLRDLFTECELTVHEVSAIKGWIRLRRDVVSRLSVELATEILSYLDYRQLVACRLVYYGLCVDGVGVRAVEYLNTVAHIVETSLYPTLYQRDSLLRRGVPTI
jgi:exoribonuclease II